MRTLANGVINETYRYGPIENIHAGSYLPDSSVPSRISPRAEQEVVTTTAQRLLPTVHALYRIITKKTGETLEEKIVPFLKTTTIAYYPEHSRYPQNRNIWSDS